MAYLLNIESTSTVCSVAISKDAELEMELYCETGKGYVPAGSGKSKDLPIGVIAIDALFMGNCNG